MDTAPQPGTENQALTFPLNTNQYGTDISHTAGSGSVTLNSPGVYMVSFHTTVAPQTDPTLPLNSDARLQLNGTNVTGGVANHVFTNASENANLSFSIPVSVTSAPATLQVVPDYAGSNYYNTTMTVQRIGSTGS